MIKWPKPTWLGDIYGHSDATLKQAVHDAIEEVAKRVEVQRNDVPANGFEFAAAIRALIEEMPQ